MLTEARFNELLRGCDYYLMPDDSDDLSRATGGPAPYEEVVSKGVESKGGTARYIVASADGIPVAKWLLRPSATEGCFAKLVL